MQPVLERGSIDNHLTFFYTTQFSYQCVHLICATFQSNCVRVCTLVLFITTAVQLRPISGFHIGYGNYSELKGVGCNLTNIQCTCIVLCDVDVCELLLALTSKSAQPRKALITFKRSVNGRKKHLCN